MYAHMYNAQIGRNVNWREGEGGKEGGLLIIKNKMDKMGTNPTVAWLSVPGAMPLRNATVSTGPGI
jgi:hypothetical protein